VHADIDTTAASPHLSGSLTRLRRVPSRPDEETVLWFGRSPEPVEPAEAERGADADEGAEMEIAPSGRSEREEPAEASRPLGDALAALEELSRVTPRPPTAGPPARSGSQDRSEAAGPATGPVRRQPPTPAGRAYRRLRRIFPG
jgi:hypothetical protein